MFCTSTTAKSPASSGVNMSLITRHTGQCAVTDRRTIRSCSKKVISTLLLFVVVTVGGRIHVSPSCCLERRESTRRLALKSGKKPEIDRKLFDNHGSTSQKVSAR